MRKLDIAKEAPQVFCPTCGKNREVVKIGNCDEMSIYEDEEGLEQSIPYAYYSFFQCKKCTCPVVTVWSESFRDDDDELVVYPIPPFTTLVNETEKIKSRDVRRDLLEADRCFHNGLFNAFAVMARRTVHSICHDKEAKGDTIKERVNYIVKNQVITKKAGDLAIELADLGDFGAHPEWPPITEEQAEDGFERLLAMVRMIYDTPEFGAPSWRNNSRRYRHLRDPAKALALEAKKKAKAEKKEQDRKRQKQKS